MAQARSSSRQSDLSAEHPADRPTYGEPDVRPGQWVPLGPATKAFGLSRAGVYRRIRTGVILSRPRGNRGLEVFVPDERERPPEQLGEGDADVRLIRLAVTGQVEETGGKYVLTATGDGS